MPRRAVLALFLVAATPQAALAGRWSVRDTKVAERFRTFRTNARALAVGIVKHGPIHTWRSIRDRPVLFGSSLVFTGLLGAGAQHFGLNPDPIVVGIAGTALLYQMTHAIPGILASRGAERWQRIGSHLVWPPLLVGGGAALGVMAGEHQPTTTPPSTTDLATTFGRSILMGGDEPAVFLMALPPKERTHRRSSGRH